MRHFPGLDIYLEDGQICHFISSSLSIHIRPATNGVTESDDERGKALAT